MGLYMGLLHKCKYQCTNMNTTAFIHIHTILREVQIWKTNDQYQYYQNINIIITIENMNPMTSTNTIKTY